MERVHEAEGGEVMPGQPRRVRWRRLEAEYNESKEANYECVDNVLHDVKLHSAGRQSGGDDAGDVSSGH